MGRPRQSRKSDPLKRRIHPRFACDTVDIISGRHTLLCMSDTTSAPSSTPSPFARDLLHMMSAWKKIEDIVDAKYPGISTEERYQLCHGAMQRALGLTSAPAPTMESLSGQSPKGG